MFWQVHRYLLIRNPELVEEYLTYFHKPKAELYEFLTKYFPLPDGWRNVSIREVRGLLDEHYPIGEQKDE